MGQKTGLRKLWDTFLRNLNMDIAAETEEVDRAISFMRIREQLWEALDASDEVNERGWAYPIDVYVGDNGVDLFSIVTQGGKLYQVPLTFTDENLSLGEWLQVTEVFEPVSQTKNRYTIRRQKDGKYRWLFVAATSVINRVGEIDSTSLFDSFVEDAAETGDYPRVDFYHLGSSDPEKWEFGTADYLARDGCCYIATGLFDEGHPLAKAAIRAYEEQPDVWGCSIEFYAIGEPEILVMDPKVQVPVYKEGKNTRISIVKEVDAAGLFTRVANVTEENVRMKRDIMAVLEEFFADDEEGLQKFAEGVDNVNRTIKADGLVHRAKKAKTTQALADAKATVNDEEDEDEDEEDEDGSETEETAGEQDPIELDEEAISQLAKQVLAGPEMTAIAQAIANMQASFDKFAEDHKATTEEVARLRKANGKLAARLDEISKDEDQKLQEKVEDLPARSRRKATFRPRDAYASDDEDDDEDMGASAERTLAKIPVRY